MIPIIDRVVDPAVLDKTVARFREKKIILPTFAEQRDPGLIPGKIKDKLRGIGLWDLHPLNLFRITWKNEPREKGGLFGGVNALELPPSLTGVQARIVLLIGKWFPTGAHKVGAAYGCLAPALVSGRFDPTYNKAVWPSTGNYCRGGAFDSYLMGCTAVAILPELMSRERFDWLKEIGAEVIATPGCESNVKEIYDKCWEIRNTRPDCIIFNQFDEFGNSGWHYTSTGAAIEEVFKKIAGPGATLAAFVSATGSAGTIAAGDSLRLRHFRRSRWWPQKRCSARRCCATASADTVSRVSATSTCPGFTMYAIPMPWRPSMTRIVCACCACSMNRPGTNAWRSLGLEQAQVAQLTLLGISSIANVLAAIKAAKHFEMNGDDMVITLATDSSDFYASRLTELDERRDLCGRAGGLRPGALSVGAGRGFFQGADLLRPQGHSQPEVFHLGRAAGQGGRRPEPALAGPGNLAADLRPGGALGRHDP